MFEVATDIGQKSETPNRSFGNGSKRQHDEGLWYPFSTICMMQQFPYTVLPKILVP